MKTSERVNIAKNNQSTLGLNYNMDELRCASLRPDLIEAKVALKVVREMFDVLCEKEELTGMFDDLKSDLVAICNGLYNYEAKLCEIMGLLMFTYSEQYLDGLKKAHTKSINTNN